MLVYYRHIIALFLFALLVATSNAQSLTSYYKSVHKDLDLCTEYDGWLDGVFELEMLLCGDKGAYKMKSSSDIYNLSVEESDTLLELIEEDIEGRTSGYITLRKNKFGYSGKWRQIESASSYLFEINEKGKVEIEPEIYILKLEGNIRSRPVYVYIDHTNQTIEIQERFGLQGLYRSAYTCEDDLCKTLVIKPEGIVGVRSVKINKSKDGDYNMTVLTPDLHKEKTELKIKEQIKKKYKGYCDYRSMILGEYAVFEDKNLDNYFDHMQADWIKETSSELREIHNKDSVTIVSDRLKNQAWSWIEIELWTEDFISGVLYKQDNWKSEIEATGFQYNIDKSKEVYLSEVWEDDWSLDSLDTKINNKNSTWLIGRNAIYKVYFDRVNGVEREAYSYADLADYIDKGSWLERLLERDKIKD